jgi:protein-disulfide isomerase
MTDLTIPPSENDHKKGDLSASVTIVEYGDYECPHSKKAFRWIEVLLKEFGNNLCYVYRHFPLMDIHPHSTIAVMSAETAAMEGKFWEMHELLLSHRGILSLDEIISMTERLQIQPSALMRGLKDEKRMEKIYQNLISGENSGVISTPAFFINGKKMEGPISLEILRQNVINILSGLRLPA